MTEPSSNTSNTDEPKILRFLDWASLCMAIFAFAALISYDWRAMESLQSPAAPSTNWIGATGDFFAYYGYLLLGFAVWIIPVFLVISTLCTLLLKTNSSRARRLSLFSVFLISAAAFLQMAQKHITGMAIPLERMNISDSGGAIGYLVSAKFLDPLLGDFGAFSIISISLAASLIGLIGLKRLMHALGRLGKWIMAPAAKPAAEAQEKTKTTGSPFDELKHEPATGLWRDKHQTAERPQPSLLEKIKPLLAAKRAAKAENEAEKGPVSPPRQTPQRPPRPHAPEKPRTAKPVNVAPVKQQGAEDATEQTPYRLPPISLLNPIPKSEADYGDVDTTARRLLDTLNIFGIKAEIADITTGPVITKYAIRPEPGTRYAAITSLENNIKGELRAKTIRIEAPIPGLDCIGIEVPNVKSAGISFREIIESDKWNDPSLELPLLFGKDAAGSDLVADLAKMPHMLVAGATGQGKSVCLNSIICGLLMTKTPEELKLIMIDPKTVEFKNYERLPHLLAPIINDNAKAERALAMAVIEMEKRLKILSKANVKNIKQYNSRKRISQTDLFGNGDDLPDKLPYIIIIIDELADLMAVSAKAVTPNIARIAAKARASGIHLILATQRPDTKVINGTIKSNIPGRVAFKTSSGIDSRTILDTTGAENLIGRGDLLFKPLSGEDLIRAQGAYIGDDEIERIIDFIEEHSEMQLDSIFTDRLARVKDKDLEEQFKEEEGASSEESGLSKREAVRAAAKASNYKKALELIINDHRISVSFLQQRLGIGFNNASRICYELEKNGVIGPLRAGPRKILMSDEELRALFEADGEPEGASGEENEPDGEQAMLFEDSTPQEQEDYE